MAGEFAFLEKWAAEDVAALLQGETPSTIATVLKNLSPLLSSKVFTRLDGVDRDEIAAAMATAKVPGSILDIMLGEIAAGIKEKAQNLRLGAARAETPRPARPGAPAPAGKKNPLSEMLSHLSPQLRQTLAASNVVPPSRPVTPAPAAPLAFAGTDFSAEVSPDQVIKPAAARAAVPRPLSEAAPVPAPRAEKEKVENGEKYVDGLRRQTAIQQIIDRQRSLREKTAAPAPAPAAPAKTGPKKQPFWQKAIQEEIMEARRLALADDGQKKDGLAFAASIVREAGAAVRRNLESQMPEIYQALHKRMFVFDDLLKSPDATLALVFSAVKPETAAMALRFAPDMLQARVMRVLPPRRLSLIQDEVARAEGRIHLADIEAAQQAVIDMAVELQNRGKVVIDASDPDLV